MSSINFITMLMGSTSGRKTTSQAILNYLVHRLKINNVEGKCFNIVRLNNDENQYSLFLNSLKQSNLFFICAPLYVDALPAAVMKILERLSKNNKQLLKDKKMMAIIHSGFIKHSQRVLALQICMCFCQQMEMQWLGGIDFGGTPIIGGQSLEKLGIFTRKIRLALDELINSIVQGKPISKRAKRIAQKRPFPLPLRVITFITNMLVKKRAKQAGCKDIRFQPFSKFS